MTQRKPLSMRQHEPLRVPENWQGQARSLVLQIDKVLDEIYLLLGRLDKRVKELEEEEQDG